MDIRFTDKRCLTPRLLDTSSRATRRVAGVIECRAPGPGVPACRFVDAIDYDGIACRYRVSVRRADELDATERPTARCPATDDSMTGCPATGSTIECPATDDPATPGVQWVHEDDTLAYRSFSRLVVDRLCTFDREAAPCLHRFPGAPPSRALRRRLQRLGGPYTLSVLDTCVTPDGGLWLQAALRGDTTAGWRARHRTDDAHVDGWLVLADATAVLGGTITAHPPAPDRAAVTTAGAKSPDRSVAA